MTLLGRLWKIPTSDDLSLRRALLRFIGDFANGDLSLHPVYLEVARGLVKAAHEEKPLVVDPFAGGGSIPLEALRLGCEVFAGDLNPLACLIMKVKVEDIPRRGSQLSEHIRRLGSDVAETGKTQLVEIYPADPDGAQPIAYIWARTVSCEAPDCGAEIPLVRSFWLCKKANRQRALRYKVMRHKGQVPRIEFELFEPRHDSEVPFGTVSRARATCPCCTAYKASGGFLAPDRVRAQLARQRGGADVMFNEAGQRIGGARLLAVVTMSHEQRGRHYRLATDADYQPIWKAMGRLAQLRAPGSPDGANPVPDEPTPLGGGSGAGRAFSLRKYGMMTFGDLFTARQKLALVTLAEQICTLATSEERELLAIVLSKFSERCNSICDWMVDVECPGHLYTQQVIPPGWDFAEAAPFSESSGSFGLVVAHTAANASACYVGSGFKGDVHQLDACEVPLPDESSSIFFTDPPYYDAVPYADLSDFFFVWLKRTLPHHPLLRDPFDGENPLTPKTREAVQDEVKLVGGRPKDRIFFEEKMSRAFAEGRRVLKDDGIGCIVFAHKTTEGWEALLSGLVRGGWVITASWPIATERSARMRAHDSAALESSVHLVCRPRSNDASVGDWTKVIHELPDRIQGWMDRLSGEGVRGADLVFSCIGPAMELFSRHLRVETADGETVGLAGNSEARSEAARHGFLWYIWQVVGRTALRRVLGSSDGRVVGDSSGALEEDARLTALFLWTLQSTENDNNGKTRPEMTEAETADEDSASDEDDHGEDTPRPRKGGFTLIFDVARRFAQPLGIDLEQWRGRVIEIDKGIVRLIPITERSLQLFGREGAEAMARRIVAVPENPQVQLFPEERTGVAPAIRARGPRGTAKGQKTGGTVEVEGASARNASGDRSVPPATGAPREPTTLDRVHAAMLLQASGQAAALRALLEAETKRGPDFLRLANALSALYPTPSEEKRLLDAMLLAVPRR